MYPFVTLPFQMELPVFYLVISLDVCLCLLWLFYRSKNYTSRTGEAISVSLTMDVALALMIGSFVGARLFHVVYENPEIYLQNPIAIFYFWNGGFVFYGGAILGLLSGWAVLKFRKVSSTLTYFDLFTPIASLSYALGRLGCLMAGCCYGKHCSLPWAIDGRHPTQVYASLWELGVLSILLGSEKTLKKPGQLFFLWLPLHAFGRLLMESLRDDFRGYELGLSVSSWISLILIAGAALYWIRELRTKK